MNIQNILKAGILGSFAYYIIKFFLTLLVTGTDTVSSFFVQIVPLAIAFAVVWYMISAAMKTGKD